MKKIKLIFAVLVLSMLTIASCENDGGDSKIDLQVGAVPNITKNENFDSFINLISLSEGTDISISFTVDKAQGDIASMDVVLFYTKGENLYTAVLESNVTTFPKSYTLTQNDLITYFSELNSTTDFELGDQLRVSAVLTLNDGTILKLFNDDGTPNFGQDIANSNVYKVSQVYNVSCPSDLGGTYSVITSGESTDPGPTPDENPISNFPYSVTITDDGGGSYTISDAFGGVYILWYDIYGLDFEVEGKFSDVCGTISGEFPEPFGTNVTYTGTVDSETGVITINWINGFDDQGVSVFTKVN